MAPSWLDKLEGYARPPPPEGLQTYARIADRERALAQFAALRPKAEQDGLVARLAEDAEGFLITLEPDVPARSRVRPVHVALFLLTLLAATLAGALFTYGYFHATPLESAFQVFLDPRNLLEGLVYYALPLMAILSVHELGHLVLARRHGMRPSIPYFLPIPPPLGFTGTFGAVISVRGAMPDRRALLEVGAAGPLAGLGAALLVLVVGLGLSGVQPGVLAEASASTEGGGEAGKVTIQTPLLYDILASLQAVPGEQSIHPTALAGWVGLLLTSIQLLPIGQLDGGHIARALLGRHATWLGIGTAVALLGLGALFPGWILLALIGVLSGIVHPRPLDDVTRVRPVHVAVGLACIVVLVLTFIPVPLRV